MKVYLVWDGYEDVTAVFLNREKAQEFVDKIIEKDKSIYLNMSITEQEVTE